MDLNWFLEKSMDGFELFVFFLEKSMDGFEFFWGKAWVDLNCFLEKSIDGFELFFGEKHGWI